MSDRTVKVILAADIAGYETAMGRASKATSSVADSGDKASARIKAGLASAGKVAGTTIAVGTAGAATLITKLGKTGTAYNSLQQSSRAALGVILGSTEAVNEQMAKFDAFASKSPFSKQLLLEAQQQMLGFQVAAEKVIPALDAVQNAVAAQGKGAAEIERGVYALSQMNSMGKYTGETIRDLGVLGIDSASILAEAFGVTSAEIRDMASKPGGIPVDQVWDPLVEGLQTKFGGATDAIKQQWVGATDRIVAANREIGSRMMEPFISKEGGGQAVVWANDVADALGAVRDKTDMVTEGVLRRLQPALDTITPTIQGMRAAVQGFSLDDLNRGLDQLSRYAVPLSGVAGWLIAMSSQWPFMRALGLSLNPVLGAVIGLTAASPELRAAVSSTWEAFKPGVEAGGELLAVLGNLTNEIVGVAAPGMTSLGEATGKGVSALIDLLLAASPILGILPPIVSVVASLVGVVGELPAPILGAVAAFGLMKALGVAPALTGFAGLAKQIPAVTTAMSAYRAGLSPTTSALAGLHTGLQSGRATATAFGTAMKTAFISNAPLLAITAVVTALSIFATNAANAKARADSYRQALDQAGDSADRAAEAIRGVLAEQMVSGANMDWGIFQRTVTGYNSVADAIEGVGLSLDGFQDAVMGSQEEADAYVAKLHELAAASDDGSLASVRQLQALREIEVKLGQSRTGISDAERAQAQLARATGDGADAAEKHARSLEDEARAAQQAQQAVEAKARAERAALDAAYAVIDAQESLNEAIADGAAFTRDGAGTLDLYSVASRRVMGPLGQFVDGLNRGAQALVDQGATQSEINAYLEESQKQFAEAATRAGAYEGEVQGVATSLGLVSSYKSMVIDMTVETEAAEQDITRLREQVQDEQDQGGLITIQADSTPMLDELFAALGIVRNADGTVTIDADTYPLVAELLLSMGIIDTSTGEVTIDGDKQPVLDKAAQAKSAIDSKTGTIKIHGEDYATPEAERIRLNINAMAATIKVRMSGGAGGLSAATATLNADGAVHFFNRGGIRRENHIAQVTAPGTWRVWGEDETGGEAYIPLAESKRPRSAEILEWVANYMDYDLVPKGASRFADGAAIGKFTAPGAVPGLVAQVTAYLENPFTGEEVEARVARTVVKYVGGR